MNITFAIGSRANFGSCALVNGCSNCDGVDKHEVWCEVGHAEREKTEAQRRCSNCEHWDLTSNYGTEQEPVHPCRGMKSIDWLGCDTDCWFGTEGDFFCADFEERK